MKTLLIALGVLCAFGMGVGDAAPKADAQCSISLNKVCVPAHTVPPPAPASCNTMLCCIGCVPNCTGSAFEQIVAGRCRTSAGSLCFQCPNWFTPICASQYQCRVVPCGIGLGCAWAPGGIGLCTFVRDCQ